MIKLFQIGHQLNKTWLILQKELEKLSKIKVRRPKPIFFISIHRVFSVETVKTFENTFLELILRGKDEYQLGNSIQKLDGPCIRSLELIGQYSVTACSRIGHRTFIIQGRDLRTALSEIFRLFLVLVRNTHFFSVLVRSGPDNWAIGPFGSGPWIPDPRCFNAKWI